MNRSDSQPLVSIVLPVHNGWRFFEASIRSCLEQTWPSLELVIVDDGSTERRTETIIGNLDDERVRVVRLAENAGLPRALNAGFREARGDLLTWTSDDNLYRPEAIRTMANVIEQTGADFVYARATTIDDEGRIVGAISPRPAWYLALENGVGACFLYTRRAMQEVGDYDPDMFLTEDYDYWVRVSKRFRMVRIDEDLYLYRRHGETLSQKHGRRRVEEMIEKVRHAHFSRAEILRAEGRAAFDRRDRSQARRKLLAALLLRPWWLSLLRPLAIATLPAGLVRRIVALKSRISPRES